MNTLEHAGTISIWSENSRASRKRTFLGAIRVSPLEFHVWQDVQRCFTFIACRKSEVDEVFETLAHHGYTLDISERFQSNMMVRTPSPKPFSPSPSLNISSSSDVLNRSKVRTPLWAAVAFNSGSPSVSKRDSSQQWQMNRLSSSPIKLVVAKPSTADLKKQKM